MTTDLQKKAVDAVAKLLTNDKYLLEHDVNERTITHWLAVYLRNEFEKLDTKYDVDCEYNRNMGQIPKWFHQYDGSQYLETDAVLVKDEHSTTAFPDIIVHKRGSNEHNLLVVEAKKLNNPDRDGRLDRLKLTAFLDERHPYWYKVGLALVLRTGRRGIGAKLTFMNLDQATKVLSDGRVERLGEHPPE